MRYSRLILIITVVFILILSAISFSGNINGNFSWPWNGPGVLFVTSSPSPAKIYIDGQFHGFTPLQGFPLAKGQHNVVVTSAGYLKYDNNVYIRSGKTTRLEVDLEGERIFDIVYPGFSEEHLEKINDLGVNHLTIFLCWNQAEPEDDNFDFDITDQRIQKYSELDMPPKAIVIDWWTCKPDWLSDYEEADEVFIQELDEFTRKSVEQYGADIKYWMIGNELNGVHWDGPIDPKKVKLYKQIASAAKQTDFDIYVGTRLAFDSLDINEANWYDFLMAVREQSEFVGIQVYPVGAGYDISDNYVGLAVDKTEKVSELPVWVTETGASTCQCQRQGAPTNHWENCRAQPTDCDTWVDQELQADYVKANMEDAINAGAFGVSVYDYAGDIYGYSLIDEEAYWNNAWKFEPKEAYYAYQDIIEELTDDFMQSA
jgi:hypothetical protein